MNGERMLLIFLAASGDRPGWVVAAPGAVEAHGLGFETLPGDIGGMRLVLAAPGDRVALHWLDLPEGLPQAQAEAAARLALGAAIIGEGEAPHIAVGAAERGRRCVGVVDADELGQWLAALEAHGLDADQVVPEPLLLLAPDSGYRRREAAGLSCYRGPADGFAAEPLLARHLVGEGPVEEVSDPSFEAELYEAALRAPLDLRQGAFARRCLWRPGWRVEAGAARRMAALALLLLCATFALGVADLFRHAHAAGRLEREARALAPQSEAGSARPSARAEYAALSSALFDALRATPNADLAAIDYQGEAGTLSFTVRADGLATAEALRDRLAGAGHGVEAGAPRQAEGRTLFPMIMRPM